MIGLRLYKFLRQIAPSFAMGRRLMPRYPYMFNPAQLSFLVRCLDETSALSGAVVEVGCATGYTTLFLVKHLDESKNPRRYFCVDTFQGFEASDVMYERTQRNKHTEDYTGFAINDEDTFRKTMRLRSADRVEVVREDIKMLDVSGRIGPISMCLLDVDLYAPTLEGLRRLWPMVEAGGIIVVDDVMDKNIYDGAFSAFEDFCREMHLEGQRLLGKLGVLRKG